MPLLPGGFLLGGRSALPKTKTKDKNKRPLTLCAALTCRVCQGRFGPPAHQLLLRTSRVGFSPISTQLACMSRLWRTAYFVRGSLMRRDKDAVRGKNVRRSHAKMRKTLEPRVRSASTRFENRFRSVACRRTRQRSRPRAVAERALRRNPRPTGPSYELPSTRPARCRKAALGGPSAGIEHAPGRSTKRSPSFSVRQRTSGTPAVLLTRSKCYLVRESNPLLPDYQSGAQPLSCH